MLFEHLEVRIAPATGSIAGFAFHDADADGLRDPGETPRVGWTIFLDGNNNGRPDAGEPSRVTGSDGSYSFEGLAPGSYIVTEVPQAGWRSTQSGPAGGAQSVLIPVADPRDHVYDPVRGQLDISTSSGYLERYDVASQSFLPRIKVGTSLRGIDIAPDGKSLYVGEAFTSLYVTLHKVDIATGTVTDLVSQTRDSSSGGAYNIAIGSNGRGLVSSSYDGFGFAPVSTLDVAAGTLTRRLELTYSNGSDPPEEYIITRGAGRNLLLLASKTSPTDVSTFDPVADKFLKSVTINRVVTNVPMAVNRDGSLIAMAGGGTGGSLLIYDRALNLIKTLEFAQVPTPQAGLAFDPVRDVLYAANDLNDEIVAIDTRTWTVLYRMNAGESLSTYSILGTGEMSVSDDGTRLFLTTTSGVRMYRLDAVARTVALGTDQVVAGLDFGSVSTALPGASIGDIKVIEGDVGATEATFTVSLSFASNATVTVGYATADGTAVAGRDYAATAGTLAFAPGETRKTITVPLLGDTIGEDEETFTVNLTVSSGALIADAQGQARVIDPDPQITVADVAVIEGDGGTTVALFTVRVEPVRDRAFTVGYATVDGTAVAGRDYAATAGTLTFAPGEASKTIVVPILGDNLVESDETFSLRLTTPEISLAAEIRPGPSGSSPGWGSYIRDLFEFDGDLYFAADDGVHGRELWKFDGHAATLVADINPGAAGSNPRMFTLYQGALYFAASDEVHGNELWRYDGTAATLAADIGAGSNNSAPGWPVVFQDKLYFSAWDGITSSIGKGIELWSFDGTAAKLVADIVPGVGSSEPGVLAVMGGFLYFAATTSATGREIFRFNGVSVSLAVDLWPGSSGSEPAELTVVGNTLYFSALGPTYGRELWKYDGIRPATVVADIRPGSGNSNAGNLTRVGNELFFNASDGATGYEPWKTNGTTTTRVAEIVPGPMPSNSFPSEFTGYGNSVYFAADDGVHGRELWVYANGTATMLRDLYPGLTGSSPGALVVYRDALYFRATTEDGGAELWKYDLAHPTGAGIATILDDDHSGSPPVARDDTYVLDEDSTLTIAALGVLTNDADADGSPLAAALVAGPAHGTLTLNADGSFTYTPSADYSGPDSFTYRASDGAFTSGVATVTLTVMPVNDRPVAVTESFTTVGGTMLTVAAPGLLANDADTDGDPITAVLASGPSHGTLTLNADGSFTYTPAAGFSGADSFTYKARDGQLDSVPVSVSVSVSPTSVASVRFLGSDTATHGDWVGVFGADGYVLPGIASAPPAYATITPSGHGSYTWAESTADPRGTVRPGGGRSASTWYAGSSFSVDVALSGGQPHRLSLYFVDWDSYGGGRSQTVELLDAASGAVLDTRTLSGFQGGVYLSWQVTDGVRVRVTNLNPASNAVLSGLFLGDAPAPPTTSARFLGSDNATGGGWSAAYGADGFLLPGVVSALPAYAAVTPSGHGAYTWAESTADPRATTRPGAGRVAATWYAAASFDVDVQIAGGQPHRLSLYFVDWDNYGGGRSQRVELLDAATGAVLDTRTLSGFQTGVYLSWEVTGGVRVRVTNLNPASNAVLSGLFLGDKPAPPAAVVSFVGSDAATRGAWRGVYGGDGYTVVGDAASLPAGVTVAASGQSSYTWDADSADPRAPQRGSGAGRVAATWYAGSSFTVDVGQAPGSARLLSLYFVDWDSYGGGRSQKVELLDAATGAVLDSRTVSGFQGGVYLTWRVSGSVRVRVTNLNPAANAVLSGLFLVDEPAPFAIAGPPRVNPADFVITTFAKGLEIPISMQQLEDGSILVSVASAQGQLLRLVDADGDGVADGPGTYLDPTPATAIITAVRRAGDLVFTSVSGMISILRAGAGPADPYTRIGGITLDFPAGWNHSNVALAVRPTPGQADQYDLFFNVGSKLNAETTTDHATLGGLITGEAIGDSIYMVTVRDTGTSVSVSGLTRIASGLRNAAGIAFDPATGDLYFQDNGINGLIDSTEPLSADELNRIAAADIGGAVEDFGFADSYIEYRTGRRVGDRGIQPLVAFLPHPDPLTGSESEGPLDIAFAPAGFPAGLNRGIFVGFYGEGSGAANAENPVVYYDLATGEYFDFILNDNPAIDHPLGLLSTADALYVADWSDTAGASAIYKIARRPT